MSYTTVVAGTVITASWANANVRDQVVTPFASATVRDAAITSPVEGMVCHLNDTNELWSYTGAAWVPVAGIYRWLGGSPQDTTVTSSGTEVFDDSLMLTNTLVDGYRYRVAYHNGLIQGTAANQATIRLRYEAGSTVTSGGTLIKAITPSIDVTGMNEGFELVGYFLAPSSASYTVGVSIERVYGANDIALAYDAGAITPYLEMERIASS